MGNITVDVMPPAYWQDFERMTLDWAKKAWGDPYAQANGRAGQAQAGVDVYGSNMGYNCEYTGVQCKKRTSPNKPGADAPSNTLTIAEIDAEIALARTFEPALGHFIIATTAPRDARLQEHVRVHNLGQIKPVVSLMFWDDYVTYLNDHRELMSRYYADVLEYRSAYKPDEHYYLMLFMAFDRPAIQTPLHLENRATDLIEALAHTQAAIKTGTLRDRDNRIIDQARVPKPLPKELRQAATKLKKARDLATQALADGHIREWASCLEIKDRDLTDKINTLRSEAVDLLNQVLQANNLECVPKE